MGSSASEVVDPADGDPELVYVVSGGMCVGDNGNVVTKRDGLVVGLPQCIPHFRLCHIQKLEGLCC